MSGSSHRECGRENPTLEALDLASMQVVVESRIRTAASRSLIDPSRCRFSENEARQWARHIVAGLSRGAMARRTEAPRARR